MQALRPGIPHRRGFTLIELLVVISIIAVLISLITPAVMSARAAARRAECANNLKNIGIAMQNFATAHKGNFPRMGVQSGGVGQFRPWTIDVLPYLDQAALHRQMRTGYVPSNLHLRVFACPDDASAHGKPDGLSYVVNVGYGGHVSPTAAATFKKGGTGSLIYTNWHLSFTADGGKGSGVFWIDTDVSIDDLNRSDGVGRTLLVTENVFARSFTNRVWYLQGPNTFPDRSTNGNMMGVAFVIGDDGIQLQGEGSAADDPTRPTGMRILSTNLQHYGINYGIANGGIEGFLPAPNSYHSGGVNGLFADGRVEFLNEFMDHSVYARLITWDGASRGEAIDSDR